MWPFKRKPFLDPETADWHIENFEWLVRCSASSKSLTQARLVLPKVGYFNTDGEKGHALAERIFAQVKDYAQIGDWPIKLVAIAPNRKPSRSLFEVVQNRGVLGTFETSLENIPQISYASNLVDDPVTLVSTLAHEIGHMLIHGAPLAPICETDETEFLTDLAAVYMGFGVFLANNSFTTEQWRDDGMGTQGWRTQRQGYLPEPDLVFATALFIAVKGLDPAEARTCLKPHLAKSLDAALLDLKERRGDVDRIAKLEAD